jgi:threonine/homoserine/homoserine lactone efflux protein
VSTLIAIGLTALLMSGPLVMAIGEEGVTEGYQHALAMNDERR